jgi:hypothetical protein
VFGTGLRFPISNATPGAGNTYHVMESYLGTPAYPVSDPRLLFVMQWQLNLGNEVQASTTITLEWLAFKVGGAWVQAPGLPVSDAGSSWGVWSPAAVGLTLPANSMIQYRACYSFANPAVPVPVSPKNHILGFDKSTVATTLAGLNSYKPANGATSETAVPTGTPGSIFLTPSAAVAKGGDGRPAFAIVSDSIGYGENGTSVLQSWTARREWSHLAIGLDDAAQSKRCAFVHFGIPGQSPTGTGFSNRSSWVKKLDALKYITDTYGEVPFDKVLSAMGENAVSNTPQLAAAIIPHYQLMTTEWGRPLIQAQLLPRTRSIDRWQSDAGQVPNVAGADTYPTGDRWLFNAACDPGGSLRTGGYLADSYRTWAAVSYDQAGKRDKYAVRPYSGTMTANYSGGVITLDTAPPPGIAFEFAGDAYATNMATSAGTDQLTLTGVTGTVQIGMSTALGTRIIAQISGTPGGAGVYQMNSVIGFNGNFADQGFGFGTGIIYDVNGSGPYVCSVVPIGISTPPGAGTLIREIPGDGSSLHPSGRLHSTVLPQATINWKISAGLV